MYYNVISSGSKGNATLVVSHKTVILIDMGITFKRLEEGSKEIGITPNDITGAIFTHNHSDHINGLRFIPVKKQYALEGTLPSTGHNIVKAFETFRIGDFEITPIPTSHDAINPCGFILKDDKEKMVYVTDTGVFPKEDISYCLNPDYIILESNHDLQMLLKSNRPQVLKQRIYGDHGHLSNEDSAYACLDILGKNTKEIVLAHLSEECNTPELALKAYKEAFSYKGVNTSNLSIRTAWQWKSTLGGKHED